MTSSTNPCITLKSERLSDHPWLYHTALNKPDHPIKSGSVVDIINPEGAWLARGFYNNHSRIAVRVLTRNKQENIDASFFKKRIENAIHFRHDMLQLHQSTNAYRLVHSEGDDLSGLVIDRLDSMIVLEFFSLGMYRFRDCIIECLKEFFPHASYYWFAEKKVQKQESFDCTPPTAPSAITVIEHGLSFHVEPGQSHKTGFYLDQRDNRLLLSRFCRGKRVLDICSFSGGFSVYAKKLGGASEVLGLDLDEAAVSLSKANAALNQVTCDFIQADMYEWLEAASNKKETFDVVILDPPRLTKARDEMDHVLKQYAAINRLALSVTAPNGILLTCSCTGLVREEDFLKALRRASFQAERTIQIFHISGAGADHPFLTSAPEGRYLKTVWCRVF